MRPRVDENRRVGAVRDQLLEHRRDRSALLRPGVELAVAVRAGAALAEAVVRLRIDDALLVQRGEIAPARLHRLPALDHDRRHTVLRQTQRRENAGGSITDDHDGPTATQRRKRRRTRGLGGGRMLASYQDAHAQPHVHAATRVERATQHAHVGDLVEREARRARRRGAQRCRVGGEIRTEHELHVTRHEAGSYIARPRPATRRAAGQRVSCVPPFTTSGMPATISTTNSTAAARR